MPIFPCITLNISFLRPLPKADINANSYSKSLALFSQNELTQMPFDVWCVIPMRPMWQPLTIYEQALCTFLEQFMYLNNNNWSLATVHAIMLPLNGIVFWSFSLYLNGSANLCNDAQPLSSYPNHLICYGYVGVESHHMQADDSLYHFIGRSMPKYTWTCLSISVHT